MHSSKIMPSNSLYLDYWDLWNNMPMPKVVEPEPDSLDLISEQDVTDLGESAGHFFVGASKALGENTYLTAALLTGEFIKAMYEQIVFLRSNTETEE